jgi:POT family proton-dependent oligopeptide transporter
LAPRPKKPSRLEVSVLFDKIRQIITSIKAHPIGFWYIFWGELAERAAYYGMRAVLALFLVDVMHFDDGKSGMVASFFSAGCYLLCLAGGWVSDRYFGKFWTIILFAVPYLIGYPLLGIANNEGFMYFALVLLAIGSGVIKPNLSPLMGSMYKDKPDELKDQAFTWFYAAINLGAGLTSVTTPWIRTEFGFEA